MLKFILVFLAINFSIVCFSQTVNVNVFFDDPVHMYQDYIEIDTVSNPNNIWQIGQANKPLFNTATTWGGWKVLITDSVNSYPINDTSYFYFKHRWCIDGMNSIRSFVLAGEVWVDTDSLNDFGIIEFSSDDGASWMDLTTDTSLNTYMEYLGPPLTGASAGWYSFYVWCDDLTANLTVCPEDIIFRFGMISDSLADGKDGIMFSYLEFSAGLTAVHELEETQNLVFPNPAANTLYLNSASSNQFISAEIIDLQGNIVSYSQGMSLRSIDISGLETGIYVLKIELSDGAFVSDKFIKN